MFTGRRLALSPLLRSPMTLLRSRRPMATSPIALVHSGTQLQRGAPPARDGAELSEPLKSADIRAFWDKMGPSTAPAGTPSSRLDVTELRSLLKTIIHKKAVRGAVAMELYTQQCCDLYESLDKENRRLFLQTLAHEFCAPKGNAAEAARAYLEALGEHPEPAPCAHLARRLRDDLTPLHTELFDQINRLPGGFAFLVHMRADMLELSRANREDKAARAMSDALMKKLETWIIGTLDLKRITWNSPAWTIEKLGQYEAVHAVQSWLDVKRRLGNGRRCFGFFHRSVPMEPLVFVWVALTDTISSNVQAILREPAAPAVAEEDARCAIFYSITSQPGLAGVDLGNFLIKRVVAVLRAELPNISTFCTLSPLPRFRAWLEQWLSPACLADPPRDIIVPQDAQERLQRCVPGAHTWTAALRHIIDSRGWTGNAAYLEAMEPVVRALGAHYLVNVKRGRDGNAAFDPVANFHLRNGACLHRLNWRGNTSYHGLRQSLGLMCNYNYVLDRIVDNNERYVRDGAIAVSGDDPFIARASAAAAAATAKL